MQKLNEIIKSLDGKAVSSYTKLYGRYERNGIVYHIRNVYGGQFKFATVSIEIPCEQIFENYRFDQNDKTALTSYIMREFSLAAHMANDAMQQSESNVQTSTFLISERRGIKSPYPMHLTRTAFCACRRFSASSKISFACASRTSSVISSPL